MAGAFAPSSACAAQTSQPALHLPMEKCAQASAPLPRTVGWCFCMRRSKCSTAPIWLAVSTHLSMVPAAHVGT
eukprot:6802215-Prymnesium_polylepis.1